MRGALRGPLWLAVAVAAAPVPAAGQDRSALTDEFDRFAAAFFDELQVRSIAENVEYCGYFGFDRAGQWVATPPTRGDAHGCLPDLPPPGFDALASYHTHAAYDIDSEVPSVDDMLSDIDEAVDGYIATPGGRLWLNLFDEEVAILLCGPGCVTADVRFRECAAYPPDVEYTLDELYDREDNDPGYC